MTAREFLKQYCEKNGWPTDDGDLREVLADCGKVVHRGDRDVRRWYVMETVVKDFDGTLIRYVDYIITGDNSMSDMDLEYDLDEAKIVERKEREIIEIYYE